MIKVMIADDEVNAREGIAEALDWKKLDAELICVASNGKQIVEAMKKDRADLLILDINMPIMSGIDVARYVKENSPETQIVLLSAYAEFEYARDAVATGIREYLLKPINFQKISKLSKIVYDVAKEIETTNKLIDSVYDASLHTKIKKAAQDGSVVLLEEILKIPNEYKKTDVYKSYCIQVLKMVHNGLRIEESRAKQGEICFKEQLMNCKTVFDINKAALEEFEKLIADKNDNATKNEKLIQQIRLFVEKNFHDSQMTVQSISARFGYVPDYLAKLFKKDVGISLKEWIVEYRLNKAVEFLDNSELSVWKIAELCGYKTSRGFVKNFKSKKGITPAEYRESIKARGEAK